MLQDAERRNGTEATVKVWMKQLRDVVSEADDLLDEVQYEVLRKEVKKRDHTTSKIQCLPNLKKFSFRREMSHKIKKINTKLSEINTQALRLGLHNELQGSLPYSLPKQTHPYLDRFNIVGREKDELHIVNLLTESKKEEKLMIIPVVGIGGIGKTALAKSVYNNPKIKKEFDAKAWSCVSVKVDINRLLEMIYESLTSKKCELPTMENLVTKLREELGSKRYLLVLDDVWDERRAYWDEFRSCLENVNSQNGNAIIVTTRKLEIGTNDMKKNSCKLQVLSDNEGWFMFKEIANPLPELEEIGRDVVKKCVGLPLLLRVIGSMLQNNSDKDKWLSVQESMDTIMKKEELIQLWMALGLLQSDMEDVGNDIFKILDMASRTLHTLFLRAVVTHVSFQDFKCLRILKLRSFSLTRIHDSVGDLVHLRVGREKGCQIGELGSLKHLGGKLVILNLEDVGSKEEASKADLVGKKNLYKITFCWKERESNEGVRQKDKEILERLQNPANVKILTIKNYLGPEWSSNGLEAATYFVILSGMDSVTSLSSSVGLGSSVPVSLSLKKLRLDVELTGLTLLRTLALGPFSKEVDCFPSLKGIEKLRSSNTSPHWRAFLYGNLGYEKYQCG
nr:hypothetical protein [Tanacetum cinerariifolium]